MQMELIPASPTRVFDALRAGKVVRLPARELADMISDFGDRGDETKAEIAERKRDECNSGFLKSILDDGIIQPIEVFFDWDGSNALVLSNGHHRFFAALELELDVPVALDVDWYAYDDLPQSWSADPTPTQHETLFDARWDRNGYRYFMEF